MIGSLLALGAVGIFILIVHSRRTSQGTERAQDGQNGRVFQVPNPEGEVHRVDTSDPSSPFYGEAWARILTANQEDSFIAGRVLRRFTSREGRFSGYAVDVDGAPAFLPVSKAAWFFHPEHDASGKRIALKVHAIYTNGPKRGNLIVDAYAPLKHVLTAQSRQDYAPGATPWGLAMDYDNQFLILPHFGRKVILVPLGEAMRIAATAGIDPRPDLLTGRFWRVRALEWRGSVCLASPVQVLPD